MVVLRTEVLGPAHAVRVEYERPDVHVPVVVLRQATLDADGVKATVWDPTADGGIGSAELTARKGVKHSEAEDVSGDYTAYKYGWSQEIDGTTVNCYGNEEGHMMKALWESGDFAYSLVVRGQGDIHDTYGIDALAVEALVRAIG